MIDVARVRADTPGCRDVVHLNNAGAALPPRVVVDTVIEHLELEARIGGLRRRRRGRGAVGRGVRLGRDARSARRPTRSRWSRTRPARGTWSFYALAASFAPGDRILTSRAEYASNVIAFLQVAQRTGARVEVDPRRRARAALGRRAARRCSTTACA